MRKRQTLALALIIAMAVAASACSGAYTLGYRAGYGSDMTPPTTSRGMNTSIRYRDYGGVLSKALLLLLTTPTPPTGTTSSRVVSSSTTCGYTVCTRTTETEVTYTPPSPAEMAAYEARAKDWAENVAPAILSGAFRAEAVVDIASTDLGGDTSGFMMALNFRIPVGKFPGFAGSHLSLGMAGGKYTTHGREHKNVIDDGTGGLVNETLTSDVSMGYYGMPVKFTGLLSKRLATYVQADLNFQPLLARALDETPAPQILRVGSQWFGPFFYVSGELSIDRMRIDSLTATAEVGLAF